MSGEKPEEQSPSDESSSTVQPSGCGTEALCSVDGMDGKKREEDKGEVRTRTTKADGEKKMRGGI